jgi:hypothetical protein
MSGPPSGDHPEFFSSFRLERFDSVNIGWLSGNAPLCYRLAAHFHGVVQGVPLGHGHLNIGRIKLYSSMMFIWAYSVYSPLVAIYFLNRSIYWRNTAYKVIFSISSGTSSTAAKADLHPRMRGMRDIS